MKLQDDRIAIYSRKSRFTGKGESIGNQTELCREYVRSTFGDESAERCVVFEDEGFSGGNLNRPDFQRMMTAVRKRKFRAIVVYRLDRISRNISDFTGLIEELTRLGVSFVSIREQFDTGTPMGRAMMFIISVFSQLERETIAERIRDNMHELAKTGRWLGGNTPIGFRSEAVSRETPDGKTHKSFRLVSLPEEAEIPKLIFDLYTETDSLTAVEAELLRRRVKTRQGKDYTRFSVKAILQNPVYMVADEAAWDYFEERNADVCFPREAFDGSRGIIAYNRTDQEKGKATALLPVSEWIIAVGQHPGLIPSGQWIRVQESLNRNKSKAYRKPRRNEALLTGLLFCTCGSRMYPKLSQRKSASGELVYTYICKKKERSKAELCGCANADGNGLDAAILEQIKRLPEQDCRLAAQLEKRLSLFAGKREVSDSRLTDMLQACSRNERTIRGLIDSLAMAENSDVRLRILDRIEELTETNREIKSRILAQESPAAEPLCEEEFDNLRQTLPLFHRVVAEMPLEEKRTAVRSLVQKVIWDGSNAHGVLYGANPAALPWCEDSK